MQMNNEKDIKQRFGTANHFTVPEGYFDNFASQMMSRLPEREARVVEIKHRKRWRPIAVAAASIAFVAMGAALWFNQDNPSAKTVSEAKASTMSLQTTSEFEQAADYAMLDATDMYALLAGE